MQKHSNRGGQQYERNLYQAEARIANLEAENAYVREKIKACIESRFDPGMMGPTLDDIRHHLKIE